MILHQGKWAGGKKIGGDIPIAGVSSTLREGIPAKAVCRDMDHGRGQDGVLAGGVRRRLLMLVRMIGSLPEREVDRNASSCTHCACDTPDRCRDGRGPLHPGPKGQTGQTGQIGQVNSGDLASKGARGMSWPSWITVDSAKRSSAPNPRRADWGQLPPITGRRQVSGRVRQQAGRVRSSGGDREG